MYIISYMDKQAGDMPVGESQVGEAVQKDKPTVEVVPSNNLKVKKPMLGKVPKNDHKSNIMLLAGALVVVLAGVGTGWSLSGSSGGSGSKMAQVEGVAPGAEAGPMEAGVKNGEEFTDAAEGLLEEGGIDGEGTHHLVREGGEHKYVYMISTVIDLESFKGKTVQVWGETIAAQQAPWLMDVGKIKVIE